MNKPLVIWKGGRPRKAGPREPSGRPARNVAVLPPCAETDGLALSKADYKPCEVTERGQVIGKTMRALTVIDRLEGKLDGDEWKALAEYERRHSACMVKVKSPLDRTPPGGGGTEGVMDWLMKAIKSRDALRKALLPLQWGYLERVIDGKAEPHIGQMRDIARALLLVLDRERRAA